MKAIFTTSESSAYDDQPEQRYHFPQTYLRLVKQTIGELVVYYEPRRTTGPHSATGRQAYFAMARVTGVEPDPTRNNHYYAYLDSYVEFDAAVPFREGSKYYETGLVKGDGSTNKGAFGRSVRELPDDEFNAIVQAGFSRDLEEWESDSNLAQPAPEYSVRPVITTILSRPFRDQAFRRHVRRAYRNTCAISGLKLINGGGRPEVQAAHIVPVDSHGPDTVRNGLALTGTVHWLFDRGLISVDDQLKVLLTPHGLPEDMERWIAPGRRLLVPDEPQWQPHRSYLRWHRDHVFKR